MVSGNYRHQGPDGARSGQRKAIGRLPLPTLGGPGQHPESREKLLNARQVDVGAAHSCGSCRPPCLSFPLSRPPEDEAKLSQVLPAIGACEPLKCTKPWSHVKSHPLRDSNFQPNSTACRSPGNTRDGAEGLHYTPRLCLLPFSKKLTRAAQSRSASFNHGVKTSHNFT